MIASPEALSARLAQAGVTKVAVIDDAFDDRNLMPLAIGVEELWAQIAENEEWASQLVTNGIRCDDQEIFANDGLIELWRKRSVLQGPLSEAVKAVFLNAEEKLSFPTQVAENLRKLNLSVECFDLPTAPTIDGPAEPRLEGVQLVFLDYDLEGETRIERPTSELRSHAIARVLARRRGDTPFLVLFSSLDGVRDESERFRQHAFYLRGSFLFLRKVDAARFETLCRLLAPSCVWTRDIGHFQHFFITLKEHLGVVAADIERRFLQLDIQDYAHFQHVALQKDGAPLGEYMLELFGAVLSHEFRDGKKVQEARSALDQLDLTTQHLPFHTQPTTPVERIYRAVLTEPGILIGPATPHPQMLGWYVEHLGKIREVPPLLMLGDIFGKAPDVPVYIVMNPACDLQYAPGRKPKLDISVFLLPGKLESLAVPATNPQLSERMRWLNFQGVDYRVLWDSLRVETVPLVEFNSWQARNGFKRVARLSLPYSLALQQSWLGNMSRVGLPTSPPIHDAYDLEVFIPEVARNQWSSVGGILKQEAVVATHPADSSEPIKFCLTDVAQGHLADQLKHAVEVLSSPRKESAERLLQDPKIWWLLITQYSQFEFKSEKWCWKYNAVGTSRPALICLLDSDPKSKDLEELNHLAVALVLRSIRRES